MARDLDIEQPGELETYLRERGYLATNEAVRVRPLLGGVSNRVLLVERADAKNWVVKQALSKLRVQVDWFSDPARVHREALGMRWLQRLAPPGTIPKLLFEDHQHHVLAMTAIPDPHDNWKTMLLAGNVQQDHIDQFARLLACIHRHAWERREELQPLFADTTFFTSLRLEPYYLYSTTQVPAAKPFLTRLLDDTRTRAVTLVHGDYSPKNVLVHENRLHLLDHEVIHWGDPGFDIGFALTHLLSKARHRVKHRGEFLNAAQRFWNIYQAELGNVPWLDDAEEQATRHTLACLLARVAGRSQLEYLSSEASASQQRDVLTFITATNSAAITSMNQLLGQWRDVLVESHSSSTKNS